MKGIKKKFGKIFASVLSLLVFCSLVQMPVYAESIDEVWVNGVNIATAPDNTLQCGSGTAVYDNVTNTLTLDNAQITTTNVAGYGIENKSNKDFNIILHGSNSIDIPRTTGVFAYTEANMNFLGGGSLDIKANQNISNHKNITFDNVTITATASNDGSIISDGNVIIKNGSDISCSGTYFGFNVGGNVTITESNVTASALLENMNAFFITGEITIEQDSDVTATSYYPALFSKNDINISDSTINATSTADYGIWSKTNLAISGDSKVISKGTTGSIGASNSFRITPPLNGTVEVFLGTDSSNVTALEGSPFSAETDLKTLNVGTNKYFHSKVHTHMASATWSKDDTNHWHECTSNDGEKMDLASHTFGDWVIDTPATETTKGSKHRDCIVCNQRETVEIPVLPHTHIPDTAWTKNETSHWHECTANDGEKMNLASHTFGDWVIDTPATENTKGNKHRDCNVCGERETVEIPATGVTPEKPVITAGAGSTHQISNGKDMTLTCSGKLEDLNGVYVDGKLVDASNYSLKSGSTILTLKASYLDTLSAGKHTLKFQYKDNVSAETDFTITAKEATKNDPVIKDTASPKTGDTSNILLYICLVTLSGGVAGYGLKKKKSLSK